MGYKIAIYASLLLRTSVKAIQTNLLHLRAAGDTSAIQDSMITIEERARVTRKDVLEALEKRFTQVPTTR
jgi:2-methylisocitrate lyase-like PEP mutase family enzyme